VELVYPVHGIPTCWAQVHELLGGRRNIHLVEPLSYVPFVDLLRRRDLLITARAASRKKRLRSESRPGLREKTERPEAVEAGTVNWRHRTRIVS